MFEIAFVVEQALGHQTHGQNLAEHVPLDLDVHSHWAFVGYDVDGLSARLPVFRSNWTVRAGLRARRHLRRIRRRHGLDAIFFHTQVPAMLCGDWVRRVPSVISLDATPLQYDELGSYYQHAPGPATAERLKWRLARARFRSARHLVTWSEWAKQSLVGQYGVPPDRITVVPPGVGVDAWRRPVPRRPDVGRPVRILFVGGDLERKGGRLLIEAFRTLRPLGAELHLVTRDEVVAESGVHVHHGLQPNSTELKRLYHDCDVFALPTYGDCLPMVLSEAGAAGLPTVSTRVAAIPEVVRHEQTGLLVAPGDVDALIGALHRLVTSADERLRMGGSAVEHVARHYDTSTNTRQLLEILKIIAGGGRVIAPG